MARKNVIALLDNQPELGRGFKAQMARRRPVSRSDYRNAQRVTGKKDVDLADARDIRARGIKAPAAPSRPRRSRKSAPPAPKKKTPAPQYPTVNSRPIDDDPTKAHPRTGGMVGEAPKPRAEFDPSRTPPPLGGFRQKVKVDEHGGMSANETPAPKFNAREFAKNAAGDDWANRRNVPYNPRKDPDIQDLMQKRKSSEIRRDNAGHVKKALKETLKGLSPAARVGAGVGVGISAADTWLNYRTKSGKLGRRVLQSPWPEYRNQRPLVSFGMENAAMKGGAPLGAVGAIIGETAHRKRKR